MFKLYHIHLQRNSILATGFGTLRGQSASFFSLMAESIPVTLGQSVAASKYPYGNPKSVPSWNGRGGIGFNLKVQNLYMLLTAVEKQW